MTSREQLNLATRYARFGYTFLDKSARDSLKPKVSPKAFLRLSAGSIWQEAKDNVYGVRAEVRDLAKQADTQNDVTALAAIRRAQAYIAMHDGNDDLMKDRLNQGLALAEAEDLPGIKSGVLSLSLSPGSACVSAGKSAIGFGAKLSIPSRIYESWLARRRFAAL